MGPKEFPIALKKIGLFIGKFKNTISNFQREVTSVTKDVDLDEDLIPKNDKIKKDTNKNGWQQFFYKSFCWVAF